MKSWVHGANFHPNIKCIGHQFYFDCVGFDLNYKKKT